MISQHGNINPKLSEVKRENMSGMKRTAAKQLVLRQLLFTSDPVHHSATTPSAVRQTGFFHS